MRAKTLLLLALVAGILSACSGSQEVSAEDARNFSAPKDANGNVIKNP